MHPCMLSCFSHVQLIATLWTEAHQAHLSLEFSRQEYWSVLPCPPPGDLPDPGIKPMSLTSPALIGRQALYHLHHLGSSFLNKQSSLSSEKHSKMPSRENQVTLKNDLSGSSASLSPYLPHYTVLWLLICLPQEAINSLRSETALHILVFLM